jgi:hypothetical protein
VKQPSWQHQPGASIVSAHTASQVISIVTVLAAGRPAAVAVALAVVFDALRSPVASSTRWQDRRTPLDAAAHRTGCPGGPRRCTSRTTASGDPSPGPGSRPHGLACRRTASRRFSAAYQEQANARTDSGRAGARTAVQASDNHALICEYKSMKQGACFNGDYSRRLRFVTVRLRQLSRAACPPGQGPESVMGRVVCEGVCHEAFDYRHGYGR